MKSDKPSRNEEEYFAREDAELLRKQRELFMNSITVLGQAVEMRDQYTGGHTHRVTKYAELLGQQLELSEEELNRLRQV